ncbi:DUF6712 family protein [Pedobacter sp. 22163]|uniref:DUF6712 family protein n=1 Tax=Pedobacter sp. 22163 TaxID=3453883 RepID=UPI003F866692
MLLKTTAEIKKYFSSIDTDYNFKSIQSFILDAETDLVIPEISQELYDSLRIKYTNNELAGKTLQLFEYLQKAIVHLALYNMSDSGSFRISDSGFYVSVTGDTRPVSDKKMVAFRNGRYEAGYKALDQALAYLEKNINEPDFLAYKDSDVKESAAHYFITNSKDFTKWFSPLANSSTTYRAALSSIGMAESNYILPVLGEGFFEDLKTKTQEGTLSADEKNLVTKIQKPLASLSIAEAIPILNFNYDGKTLSVNYRAANNDNIEASMSMSDERLSMLMNQCLINGELEVKRLKKWLNTNAGKFSLYTADTASDDTDINSAGSHIYFV